MDCLNYEEMYPISQHIKITKRFQRGSYRIFLNFQWNEHWISQIKSLPTVRYSSTFKAWHIAYDSQTWTAFKMLKLPYILPASTICTAADLPAHSDNNSIDTAQKTVSIASTPLADHSDEDEDIRVPTMKVSRTCKQVSLRNEENHWLVYLPYLAREIKFLKSLKKSWFHSEKRCWYVPKSSSYLTMLQERYLFWEDDELKRQEILLAEKTAQTVSLFLHPAFPGTICVQLAIDDCSISWIKQISGRRYCKKEKFWTVPRSSLADVRAHYSERGYIVTERLPTQDILPEENGTIPHQSMYDKMVVKYHHYLHQGMEDYLRALTRQRYSWRTVRAYAASFRAFLAFLNQKHASKASLTEVQGYLEQLARSTLGDSTLHTAVNAVRFYYSSVIYCDDLDLSKVKRPRQRKRLPKVLSIQEVNALLSQTENSKHLSILYLLYGSGLRLNELLHLKVNDILWDRSQIHIVSGKGKKDRYVMLANAQRIILHSYFMEYKPIYWLFEGQSAGKPYSERSVQQIVKSAAHKAGITRKVTPHILRHCFATHLMDNGVQLPYIQQLLGHSSIKTTMIYLETSGKNYANIPSPLDLAQKSNIQPN